jgi:bifunctional DNA-binding transcriptional regulator/antitoxin component of YhaV-PrlF toxin-antitoxin module
MATPHGPHPIARNGQVVIPKDVLRAAGIEVGMRVFLQAIDNPEGAILIFPEEAAERWFEAGRRSEEGESQTT